MGSCDKFSSVTRKRKRKRTPGDIESKATDERTTSTSEFKKPSDVSPRQCKKSTKKRKRRELQATGKIMEEPSTSGVREESAGICHIRERKATRKRKSKEFKHIEAEQKKRRVPSSEKRKRIHILAHIGKESVRGNGSETESKREGLVNRNHSVSSVVTEEERKRKQKYKRTLERVSQNLRKRNTAESKMVVYRGKSSQRVLQKAHQGLALHFRKSRNV
ncbi:G patch domain-containing protein 4-like [Ptychodera flava]|uniref:G patch domain-containing protein 4-like n=1 Tax=Ptychodera flava TaxID=63121 RepID=UPI00396A42F1